MTTTPNKNSYETLIYDFINEVYVVCPKCTKRAIVKSEKLYDENAKMVCPSCGYLKTHDKQSPGCSIKSIVAIGGGIDPYFYFPLWLATEVGDHLFWAYNYEHLNFLKEFVSAKLRERNLENVRNKSIGSRLPKWITAHKNRKLILKVITQLSEK